MTETPDIKKFDAQGKVPFDTLLFYGECRHCGAGSGSLSLIEAEVWTPESMTTAVCSECGGHNRVIYESFTSGPKDKVYLSRLSVNALP